MPGSVGTQLIQTYAPAQTFTVGLAGTLTEVAVVVKRTGVATAPIDVQLTGVTGGGAPDTTNVLATGTIPAGQLTTSFQTFIVTLSGAPSVTPGEQLAIVLTTTDFDQWSFGGTSYSGGDFYRNPGSGYVPLGSLDLEFATYVTPTPPAAATSAPRGAYCTVLGNTTDTGASLAVGTFVNLDEGQTSSDSHYAGATPAIFVQGIGLTCGTAPAGYTQHGDATADMNVEPNTYLYYSAS